MSIHAPPAFLFASGPGHLEIGTVGRAFGLSRVYGVGPEAVRAPDGVNVVCGRGQLRACREPGQETAHLRQDCGTGGCRGAAYAVVPLQNPGSHLESRHASGMTDLNADHYPQRRNPIHHLDRMWHHLANQDTARSNAAQASSALEKRRHDREEVDAYLTGSARPILREAKTDGSPG